MNVNRFPIWSTLFLIVFFFGVSSENASAQEIPLPTIWFHLESAYHAINSANCIWPSGLTLGAIVRTNVCANYQRQMWGFVEVSPPENDDVIVIVMNQRTGLCLDLRNGSNASGAQYQLWSCESGNLNQQFVISHVDDAGGFIMENVRTMMCISKENEFETIKQRDCRISPTRIWYTAMD